MHIAIAEYLVLGSVFMYFDNPATLLILDILITTLNNIKSKYFI